MRYLVIISFLWLVCMGLSYAGEWHIETVGDDLIVGSFGTSIAMDNLDYPSITTHECQEEDLIYAHWTGSEWDIEIVDFPGDVGYDNSLALDSEDHPHIAYSQWTDSQYTAVKYAYWTGSEWEKCYVTDPSNGGCYSPSLALDSQGFPHITYYDDIELRLKYAHLAGDQWEYQYVDTVHGIRRSSIAIDSEDNPCIAYSAGSYLKYAHWTGSEWDIQTIDNMACDEHPGLDLDSQDRPQICYHYYSDGLKYARWTGSQWEIQVVDTGKYTGSECSIVVDSQDFPQIAYIYYADDYSLVESLKYVRWTGTGWEFHLVDTSGYYFCHPSIAIDSQENPHISYMVDDYGWWRLRYAWYEEPYYDIELVNFSTETFGSSSIELSWSVEITDGEQILGFNLYRQQMASTEKSNLAKSNNDQNWQCINTALITGQNPYTYIDSNVASGISYEYRLEAVLADQTKSTLGTCQGTAGLPNSFAITKVYPNPADDYLTCVLSLPQAGEIDLALYDLTGRLVAESKLEANEPGEISTQLEVSQLASGVYIANANWGDRQVSKPVIVAH